MLMFVITMLVILVLSGLVLVAVARGEGKLEGLQRRPDSASDSEEAEAEREISRV